MGHYILIQEGYLPGGTKQRAFIPYLNSTNYNVYIYAGPSSGYAQIALAIAANITDKKAIIFVEYSYGKAPFSDRARSYGAIVNDIFIVDNKQIKKPAPLEIVQQKAKDYLNELISQGISATILEFGGSNKEIIDLLRTQLIEAIPKDFNPKRMWLVAGSGTILKVLAEILPNTFFEVVQVGKKIWPDQLPQGRSRLHIAPEKFYEKAILQPPYPTVATYDAKLWQFVQKYGESGDYIWNVGMD